MKKLLAILALIILSHSAQAKRDGYGSTLADSLMYLHSIANVGDNFNGLVGAYIDSSWVGKRYAAPVMLGANAAYAYKWYINSYKLELVFVSDARSATKSVIKLFKELEKSGQCRLRKLTESKVVLVEGGRDIMEYSYEGKEYSPTSVTIGIFQTPLVLADEKTYGGKFPELPSKSMSPQVVVYHRAGGSKDSYERDNGIFLDGALVSGSKTIHGFGDFYDGYWYSDDWRTTGRSWAFAYVWVSPDSSPEDTIYGRFTFSSMEQFSPDKQYAVSYDHAYKQGVFQARSDAPEWIKKAYPAQELKRAEDAKLAGMKYASEHPNETYQARSYQKSEAQQQYEDRQNRWKAKWTLPANFGAQDAAAKQRERLHQESVDYYNKLHPYGEGTTDAWGRHIR